MPTPTSDDVDHRSGHAPVSRVPVGLERSLTLVARAILRLEVPKEALPEGVTISRTAHWLLVRVSETAPARLSDVAEAVQLDLSTVSRQVRDLVAAGLMTKTPDPADGRAALLGLTVRGQAVLDAVSDSRRQALADAIAGWTDDERNTLTDGLLRLGAGLDHLRDTDTDMDMDGGDR